MAIYMNTSTGEYPRHDGDLELLGWSVGEPLPTNWVEVEYVDPPKLGDNETYTQLDPIEIDGVWKMQWQKRALTADEKREIDLRYIKIKVADNQALTEAEAALLVL